MESMKFLIQKLLNIFENDRNKGVWVNYTATSTTFRIGSDQEITIVMAISMISPL